MRKVRTICGLVFLAAAASCSTGVEDSSPSLAPLDVAQLRQVLVDRTLPSTVRAAAEQNRINDVASCLEDRGFSVVRPPPGGIAQELALSSAVERLRYGIPATYQGELGIASFLVASSTVGSSRVMPADGESPAFLRAEVGDLANPGRLVSIDTGNGVLEFDANGCVGASYLNMFESTEGIRLYTQLPSQLQSDVNASLESEDSVAAALELWRSCAAENGESIASPSEIPTNVMEVFNKDGEAAARKAEQVYARLLRGCEAKSGLFEAVSGAQPAIEDRVLAANDAAVVQLQQVVSDAASR